MLSLLLVRVYQISFLHIDGCLLLFRDLKHFTHKIFIFSFFFVFYPHLLLIFLLNLVLKKLYLGLFGFVKLFKETFNKLFILSFIFLAIDFYCRLNLALYYYTLRQSQICFNNWHAFLHTVYFFTLFNSL